MPSENRKRVASELTLVQAYTVANGSLVKLCSASSIIYCGTVRNSQPRAMKTASLTHERYMGN